MSKYPFGDGVMTYPDGKEICQGSVAGRQKYSERLRVMWLRQQGMCRWCGEWMYEPWGDSGKGLMMSPSFDHDSPRGHGGQDDRIEVDGKPINAAVHYWCNSERGSKRFLTRAEWQAYEAADRARRIQESYGHDIF